MVPETGSLSLVYWPGWVLVWALLLAGRLLPSHCGQHMAERVTGSTLSGDPP